MTRKILILAANPKKTSPLRLDQELREIDEGLRRSRNRDQFSIEKRLAVRTEDLRRALLDEEPHFVHFCGHGAGADGLIVEDIIGEPQLVKAEALAGLFKLFSNQIDCVILNACYSEIQAQAISQHIKYVIGMKHAVGDAAAIQFATGFYDAIGAGRSIEDAFDFGRNAIELYGIPEKLTPILQVNTTLKEKVFTPTTKLSSDEIFESITNENEAVIEHPHYSVANRGGFPTVCEQPDNLPNGRPLVFWKILLIPAIAWFAGHTVSLILTGTSASQFVVLGTVGGFIIIILATWLGVSITNTVRVVRRGKLIRLAVYFVLAGLVSGFIGLFLWLLGCNSETIPMIQQTIGCRNTSKLVWKLVVGSSSMLALAGASFFLLIELGITRFINQGLFRKK
jgi:hypothetical protein